MSSTVELRQWFRGNLQLNQVSEHRARDFGISFVDEDEGEFPEECLPQMPPLIPLSGSYPLHETPRCIGEQDDSKETYGGISMVSVGTGGGEPKSESFSDVTNNNSTGAVSESDNVQCLCVQGVGGGSACGVFDRSVDAEECAVSELSSTDGEIPSEGQDDSDASEKSPALPAGEQKECSVVLKLLPTDLLQSLSAEGRVTVDAVLNRAARPQGDEDLPPRLERQEPANGRRSSVESGTDVRLLVDDLVSAVSEEPPKLVKCCAVIDHSRDPPSSSPSPAPSPSRKLHRKALRRKSVHRKESTRCRKKRKRRSSSFTSHHHHHHHHKASASLPSSSISSPAPEEPPANPRVNPIFVWVKQQNTTIVEVLCEDYDKRNRIRLTKTPQGWRAIPRTERLASATCQKAPSQSPPRETPKEADQKEESENDDDSCRNLETESNLEEENSNDAKSVKPEEEECVQEDSKEDIQESKPVDQGLTVQIDPEESVGPIPKPSPRCLGLFTEQDEDLPTDLSIRKRRASGDKLRIPLKIPTPTLKSGDSPPPYVKPAHQEVRQKSAFLETLLSSPRVKQDQQCVPLDLGPSAGRHAPQTESPAASPKRARPAICERSEKPRASPKIEDPPAKKPKLEDITLKNLLSRDIPHDVKVKQQEIETKVASSPQRNQTPEPGRVSTPTRSRLLELLTSHESRRSPDPATQLKQVLSDPDISIPDPLLVPRTRLASLITNPAKEIPRLLSRPELRLPEILAYPHLLHDPDLLVVSINRLQSLVQEPEKEVPLLVSQPGNNLGAFLTGAQEWHRQQSYGYGSGNPEAKMRGADSRPRGAGVDSTKQQARRNNNGGAELDAATATALQNMLWLPYMSQLEAVAACGGNREVMAMLSAMFPYSNPVLQNTPTGQYPFLNPFSSLPADYKSQIEFQQALSLWREALASNNRCTKSSASQSPVDSNSRYPHLTRKLSASPQHQFNGPGKSASPSCTSQPSSQLHQRLLASKQGPKAEMKPKDNGRPTVTCKSLLNLLSSPRSKPKAETGNSHLLAALSKGTNHQHPPTSLPHLLPIPSQPIDLSGRKSADDSRAKVTTTSRLKEEVSSDGNPLQLDQSSQLPTPGPHLWHPLFGSQKNCNAWPWRTVKVNGD